MHTPTSKEKHLRLKIKAAIIITIIGLLINGLSAIPLRTEMRMLLSNPEIFPEFVLGWWAHVAEGLYEVSEKYGFMRYGFDWLAFAHLLIAIAFIGPFRNPIRNQWVVQWGMIAAALSIVMALGWERLRGIPWWWSILDAGISYVAFLILWLCNRWIQLLKEMSRGS